jgi:hypothetical protein
MIAFLTKTTFNNNPVWLLIVVGLAIMFVVWVWICVFRQAERMAKARHWLVIHSKPCPHCLGTGRIPTPPAEFSTEAKAQFEKELRNEELQVYKDAFKERR